MTEDPHLPLVTIITICFRNPGELQRTLTSLAPLDATLFERLVIDGSPDSACESISREFEGVRHFRGPDTGKYDAMNKGVARAQGSALLFMNSGDLLVSPPALETAVRANADALSTTLLFGDAIFEIGGTAVEVSAPDIRPEHLRKGILPSHQAILIPTAFHRRHLYDAEMHFAADTKLLKQAFGSLPFRHLPFPLAQFAYGGISNSPGSWRSAARQLRELRRAHELTWTETASTAVLLARRKLLRAAFGEEWFRHRQRKRLVASGRARLVSDLAAQSDI